MIGDSLEIVGEGSASDLEDLEGWWDNPGIVAWSFALFGCFLLNVTLLLAFLIRPSLRTISNRFVMNLTVSNLLLCAIMNPLLIMDASLAIVESTSIGSICALSEGAVAIVTTSSVLSVLLIAVDQYFAVVDPLRYRVRVDKLKSGILIMSTWLISITFGFLAFFNPNPQSFWLYCISRNKTWFPNDTTFDSLTESTFALSQNEMNELNSSDVPDIVETFKSTGVNDNIDLIENTTVMFDTLMTGTITYGFVYAIVYSIFVYFIPFVAVCWIYVSIYVAAHRNSERARRTGSRPILSSASFTEEQNGPHRHQRLQCDTIEDLRKLPKISSLSSIDETSETMQPIGPGSRRRSFSSSLEIEVPLAPVEDKGSLGIVFTVGSQKVEVSSLNTEENCSNLTSPATIDNETLKESTIYEDINETKRQDTRNHEQNSSPKLIVHETTPDTWISRSFTDESDSEDECFNMLNPSEKNMFRSSRKFSSPSYNYQSTLVENLSSTVEVTEEGGKCNDISDATEQKESAIQSNEVCADDRRMEQGTKVELKNQHGGSGILRNSSEGRSSRRSSTATFAIGELPSISENFNSILNKTEKDNNTGGNNTESSACLLTPIVTITPAPNKNEILQRVSSIRSTSSYISCLKDRISNGSIFRHREEARAARISALVIVMGLMCWSPYVILLVIKNLPRSTLHHLPHKYDVLASGFLILAAYISPLLFGYRSKRVKRELRKFFCFRKELSYINNRSLMAKKVLKRRHSSTLSNYDVDHKYNIFNCVYGRNRWPKEKVQFVQVPDTALAVETCRSSFSSGASTQISSTSTDEC